MTSRRGGRAPRSSESSPGRPPSRAQRSRSEHARRTRGSDVGGGRPERVRRSRPRPRRRSRDRAPRRDPLAESSMNRATRSRMRSGSSSPASSSSAPKVAASITGPPPRSEAWLASRETRGLVISIDRRGPPGEASDPRYFDIPPGVPLTPSARIGPGFPASWKSIPTGRVMPSPPSSQRPPPDPVRLAHGASRSATSERPRNTNPFWRVTWGASRLAGRARPGSGSRALRRRP